MKVMAGIASIPERAASLEQAVRSLAPQVDEVFVSLNEYATADDYLDEIPNVTYAGRGPGNGGDAEKFAAVDDWDGIVVTCDDDLLYPPDYVEKLVAGLDRHGHDAIVGFHGGKTNGWNGSAKAATHKSIRCLGSLEQDDTDVNVLGTGALAFDARQVPVWRELFRTPNMADVYLAGHAHDFGVRMVALAHDEGWLQNICPPNGRSIYDSNRRRDGSACDTTERRKVEMGRRDWSAPLAKPSVRVSIATCARPQLLCDLLEDLGRESVWLDLHVAVFEDPSRADYTAARETVHANGWSWHLFRRHLGKQRHHELVTAEMEMCRESAADWFVFLPDDIRLVRHALPRAIETWKRLEDPATLTLWRLKDHEGQPNWTGLLPVKRDYGFEVFHVDGIYLCERPTLEALSYRCPPLPPVSRRRFTSSGVGRSMSLHLHGNGKRMYRVAKSLAVPVQTPSVMNPNVGDRRYAGVCL